MPLSSGTCLGPYQILIPLGAGGMGEVYLALDTRLDRSVALKILAPDLSRDPDRRSRFEREAKAIAALSHPHICALYDVGHQEGVDFLVMELLEGKTLAARLGSGPLDMAEVLIYAAQILDALDKAHRQGIVHRDLKPANIMLSRSGVKLLDFGLAKLRTDSPSVAEAVTAPVPLSGEGQILGTVPYMAPEQLEGKPVDARADLFAFGIIIYEMVTGRRPFEGSSPASVMGAILHTAAPPIARLTPGVPPALDRLVAVCLAKDPDDRWSTAHDALLQLKGISESVESDAAVEAQPRKARERIAWAAAALAILTAIALALVVFAGRRGMESGPVARDVLSVLPPDHTTFDYGDSPQISPDGRRVAFVTTDSSGKVGLYVRSRDALGARLLPGTDGASMPFWSPDSGMLGFFAHGQLKTIALSGGSPHAIASAPVARGGAWGRDNVILFSGTPNRPPYLVPAAGGEAKPAPVDGAMMGFRTFPTWLPDGRHYLFLAMDQVTHNGEAIRVASLDTTDTTEIVKTASSAVYSAGHLLFRRDGALLAQPLDIRTLKLAGSPVTVAGNVGFNAITYQGLFSASDTGVLAYQGSAPGSQLVWFDRQGKRLGAAAPASDYNTLCLTSDDKQIVYDLADPASGSIDLWALDVASARPSRMTFHPAVDFFPICSQASQEIIFATLREGAPNVFRQMLAAPGSEKAVVQSPFPKIPSDWSRDGRLVVYSVLDPKTGWDVEVAPLSGGQPQRVLATTAGERDARLSPDGRWMVYISNETGSFEVYVQPFPTTGAKWQVSRDGGFQPQWRHDGGELFYVTPDKKLIGVSVKTGSDFSPGETRTIMDTRIRAWDRNNSCCQYAVTRDGQRFLVNTATDETLPITLVLNWTSPPSR